MIISDVIIWFGVVEDVNDPLKLGRCRVRIFGLHTPDKTSNGIPSNTLPWAYAIQPIYSTAISGKGFSAVGIVPGTHVVGFLRDGKDFQDPIILGTVPGIPQSKPNTNLGFCDESGLYPLDSYILESDTNRLAKNEKLEETIVNTKNNSLEQNVPVANSDNTWTEPQTQYNSTYPNNFVYESRSGHIIEIDDTPEAERLNIHHKSGTFTEIYPNGQKVEKIKDNNYSIVEGSSLLRIKSNSDICIDSNATVYINGNCNIQINSNCNIHVQGNVQQQVDGNYSLKIQGTCDIISEGNMNLQAPRIDLNKE